MGTTLNAAALWINACQIDIIAIDLECCLAFRIVNAVHGYRDDTAARET